MVYTQEETVTCYGTVPTLALARKLNKAQLSFQTLTAFPPVTAAVEIRIFERLI